MEEIVIKNLRNAAKQFRVDRTAFENVVGIHSYRVQFASKYSHGHALHVQHFADMSAYVHGVSVVVDLHCVA